MAVSRCMIASGSAVATTRATDAGSNAPPTTGRPPKSRNQLLIGLAACQARHFVSTYYQAGKQR